MNCPSCLELKLINKLILLPGLYVCESKSCIFCESVEDFENIYEFNDLNTSKNEIVIETHIDQNLLDSKNLQEIDSSTLCTTYEGHSNSPNDLEVQDDTLKHISELCKDGSYKRTEIIKDLNSPINSQHCYDSTKQNDYSDVNHEVNEDLSQSKDMNRENGPMEKDSSSCDLNAENMETAETSSGEYISRSPKSSNDEDLPQPKLTNKDDVPDAIGYNMVQSENNISEKENEVFSSLEIIDLNHEFCEINMNCSTNKSVKNKPMYETIVRIDENDMKSYEQKASDQYSLKIWEADNKIFNWVRMPYYFNTHTKIVGILILHLDIFQFKYRDLFDDIRREYAICESYANHFDIVRNKDYFHKFLDQLYSAIPKLSNRNLNDVEMNERVLRLFYLLFSQYDLLNALKCEYSIDHCCPCCEDHRFVESNDYFINLERNKRKMSIQENHIKYDVKCLKCKSDSTKSIIFKKIPQFLIIHCSDGLKEDITTYDNKFVSLDGKRLSVIGVVEIGSKYPFQEYPEGETNFMVYCTRKIIHDTRFRPSYCVHFRNSNGWFNVNGFQRFLRSPNQQLSAHSLADVKFIVIGTIPDARKYRTQFSIIDYQKSHNSYAKESFTKFFESYMLKSAPEDESKKSSRKSKSHRRLILEVKKLNNTLKSKNSIVDKCTKSQSKKRKVDQISSLLNQEPLENFHNSPSNPLASYFEKFDNLADNETSEDFDSSNSSNDSPSLENELSPAIGIQSLRNSKSHSIPTLRQSQNLSQSRGLSFDELLHKYNKKIKTKK